MKFLTDFLNSGTEEQQSKKRLGMWLIAITAVVLMIAVVILVISSIVMAVKDKKNDNTEPPVDTSVPPSNYTTTTFAEGQLSVGSLLIVDETHPYVGVQATVQPSSNNRVKDENNNDLYKGDYGDVNITQQTLDAFNLMMKDFHAANSGKTGYTAGRLWLKSLYNHEMELTDATKAVLKTGCALILEDQDLNGSIYDPETKKGIGAYQWIYDNAADYGFILASDAEGEENIFRYVGVPHASYMTENEKTISEYIELLKGRTAHKPMQRSAKNAEGESVRYHVYYIASDSESFFVPVNSEAYEVSGDNVGGYIVTVNVSKLK